MAAAVLALVSCATRQTPAEALLDRLEALVEDGKIMYGHQDDLLYGNSWKLAQDATQFNRSDVYSVCGQYPAVFGTDLGGIELGNEASLDKNKFDHIRAAAVAHHKRGGFVTFSWHLRNPLTGGDSWDVTSTEVVASILPGGEKHKMFREWLKRAADFMESIKTEDGELVPIIWRPWHEHTGSWFWWGQEICTTEQYKALWKMTYDYMMVERGMTNLVWSYSPGAGGLTPELFEERYPGDDMVDMVGFDCYQYSTDEAYISDMRNALDITTAFAKNHNKIAAVTETGYEGIPSANWWTSVLYEVLKDYSVSYVLTWRNAWERAEHFYAPYPGQISAEDFKAFAALENVMMVAPVYDLEKLRVEGTKLMNESGDIVQMKGMSFGWNCLWPRFYNADAVKHIVKDWNAEIVRAAVGVELRASENNAKCYLDDPDFGKQSACAIVDAAIENGVYVLVDWHAHGLHTSEAVEFFTYMATKYQGVPNVIYEIWNEPSYKDHVNQIDYTWAEIKEYSLEVIKAIRAIEKDAIIVVGTPRWSQNVDDAADDPVTGYDNLMYTLHFYAGTHKEWLREKGDYAMSKGLALFVTECGGMNADGQGPIDEDSTQEWIDWMDKNNISYLFWSISDKEETCSMLLPSALSEGPWEDSDLRPWGRFVKENLN